jgi:hypothetical protein
MYHFLRKLLDAGLPEDTVFVKLKGSAGMLVVTVCRVCPFHSSCLDNDAVSFELMENFVSYFIISFVRM